MEGMDYIGTVLIGVIIPILVTSSDGNCTNVFIFWAILSVIVAVFVAVYLAHFRFNSGGKYSCPFWGLRKMKVF